MSKILILAGDGIGPEVCTEAIKVLRAVEGAFNLTPFELTYGEFGGAAIDSCGSPLPEATLEKITNCDAILLAAIGGPKWDSLPHELKPERGLLSLRKKLGAFANLRPIRVYDALADASTLKPSVISGIDIMIVRELTGGIYFGEPRGFTDSNRNLCINTAAYSEPEVIRIVRIAAKLAMGRDKRLCSVDKANVLEVSQFWREICIKVVSEEFPDIELSHLYIDNAAMQLVRNPKQFDVIVTSNLFGDILSDEASMITGSIGMLPSASLGDGSKPGLYEPVHGSAPDIAGFGIANPLAMISSVAMMLRHSFNLHDASKAIETAIAAVLDDGLRTADIAAPQEAKLTTEQMGKAVCAKIAGRTLV